MAHDDEGNSLLAVRRTTKPTERSVLLVGRHTTRRTESNTLLAVRRTEKRTRGGSLPMLRSGTKQTGTPCWLRRKPRDTHGCIGSTSPTGTTTTASRTALTFGSPSTRANLRGGVTQPPSTSRTGPVLHGGYCLNATPTTRPLRSSPRSSRRAWTTQRT